MTMKKFLICITLLAIITSVPMADAATSQAPFITIDPLGNYTVGTVLYINGTTNLPVNATLSVLIYTSRVGLVARDTYVEYPGCFLPKPNISIMSIPSGINPWSVNVTDNCLRGLPAEWSPYIVVVRNNNDSVSAGQYLTVLPAPNATQIILTTSHPELSPVRTILTTTQSSPLSMALPIDCNCNDGDYEH